MTNRGLTQYIEKMSYAEFVAFTGLPNTPPGGMSTVRIWRQLGKIGPTSNILDLACSTGYSSRTLHNICDCNGIGIDVCEPAIIEASRQALHTRREALKYLVADAAALPFASEMFSHIVAGSCFGFIGKRDLALSECARVLCRSGLLLVSTLHYVSTPPRVLMDRVAQSIGYRPNTDRTLAFWKQLFGSLFTIDWEVTVDCPPLDAEAICAAVHDLVFKTPNRLVNESNQVRTACFIRLCAIRKTLAYHSKYQECRLLILRLRQ